MSSIKLPRYAFIGLIPIQFYNRSNFHQSLDAFTLLEKSRLPDGQTIASTFTIFKKRGHSLDIESLMKDEIFPAHIDRNEQSSYKEFLVLIYSDPVRGSKSDVYKCESIYEVWGKN